MTELCVFICYSAQRDTSFNHKTLVSSQQQLLKVETNWLKLILVLMGGHPISIPCNIHQLSYAKKEKREKKNASFYTFQAGSLIHTEGTERERGTIPVQVTELDVHALNPV